MRRYLHICAICTFVFVFSVFFIVNNLKYYKDRKNGNDYTSTSVTPSDRDKKTTVHYVKHVTKSLSELPPMDDLNAHVLFVNTIPKSGAEVLVLLLQWLQGRNNFKHVRLKGEGKSSLSVIKQENLVYTVDNMLRETAVPLSFDEEVRFINFSSFGRQSPTYLSLICNPVDTVISSCKYLNSTANKIPFKKQLKDCWGNRKDSFPILNIPFFCGQEENCTALNENWALNVAKKNVERYYPVVGVLEEIDTTINALEKTIPFFFKGAKVLYKKHLFEFKQKKFQRSRSSGNEHLRSFLRIEMEFYEWIKSRLLQVKKGKK